MSIVYSTASEEYLNVLQIANLVFTGIFIIECIVKVLGLGFKIYLSSRWNQFDFAVVVFSVADLIIE